MHCIEKDYLVLGAGPAGLQLGALLQAAGEDYLLIERGKSAGEFFRTYPRHRKLISINKVHTGTSDPLLAMRWDWNSLHSEKGGILPEFTEEYFPNADDYVRYLNSFAQRCEVQISFETQIVQISKRDGRFELRASDGSSFKARVLVVATGFAAERHPQFPGAEWVEPYSRVSVDREEFRNKRVMVIGKGNSAFETADHLVAHAANIHVVSPEPVQMAWKTHYVGHLRAVNNNLLDTYQLKSQNSVQNAEIISVERRADAFDVTVEYTKTLGERRIIQVDRLISCVGFKMDETPFDTTTRPRTTMEGKYPELDASFQSSVPNMYFAGTLMHGLDYGKSFSGFVHGFRYNVIALFRILQQRAGHVWPSRTLERDELVSAVMRDLLRTSALFQQPGFLANVVCEKSGKMQYFEHVPAGYIQGPIVPAGSPYLKITLEFGHLESPDPFDANDAPNESTLFIHPVFRLMKDDMVVSEIHLRQDLENQWDIEENLSALRRWLDNHWMLRLEPNLEALVS